MSQKSNSKFDKTDFWLWLMFLSALLGPLACEFLNRWLYGVK